jgi:2-polyprenyl-3-methyl-5-hydroxy-6-metoxy-1,4-benzoquinol methylase
MIKKALEKMRPMDIHEKALLLREKSGCEFFDKHKTSLVEVPCPACGNNHGGQSFEKYGFSHKKCNHCLTVWCSPRPTEQLLSEYYNHSEATKYWTQLLVATDSERKAVQYTPRVNHIISILEDYNKENAMNNIAVDLGAGSGAFALSLKQTQFFSDVIAIDFDQDCCKTCENYGLNTMQGSVELIEDSTASLISMNDMVEHLFDPENFLTQCWEKLIHGGAISIACPNGEGFDYQIMKEMTVNVTPPEHLNYFNPSSLTRLLEKTGFNVISVETPGILDVQIVKRALQQNKIDMNDNQYLKDLLLNGDDKSLNGFQDFLKSNLLSSHMVIVAVKA